MNTTLLTTYMEIGRFIVTDLKKHSNDETYETQSITTLSRELSKKFGKGFSRANIWNMIHFYQDYGSVQSLTERLTWTHYCELLSINDKEKRSFYEKGSCL